MSLSIFSKLYSFSLILIFVLYNFYSALVIQDIKMFVRVFVWCFSLFSFLFFRNTCESAIFVIQFCGRAIVSVELDNHKKLIDWLVWTRLRSELIVYSQSTGVKRHVIDFFVCH